MKASILLPTFALLVAAPALPGLSQERAADFASVRHIISARCSFCHTAIPQEDGLNAASQPAKGVKFDTPADIHKFSAQILIQAVKSRRMPPDNATHITDEERELLGKWIAAGAAVP